MDGYREISSTSAVRNQSIYLKEALEPTGYWKSNVGYDSRAVYFNLKCFGALTP